MPTNGFSVKPPKVKLVAGEQKATEIFLGPSSEHAVAHERGWMLVGQGYLAF